MNNSMHSFKKLLVPAAITLLLAACAAAPQAPEGSANARDKLMQLQADPQLASRAPVAIKEAETAVRAAEEPREDLEMARHLVLLADRKVDIAMAQAQRRLSEDQRKSLSEQREKARLDSRTREADQAHSDAASARLEADSARMESLASQQQTEDLQRQIAELNAKATDRGLVVTLGDLLFSTGMSDLKGGAANNLGKLAAFLNQYPDRTVVIEGHTDNVGSDDSNFSLSQRRADSVKSYLVSQGVNSSRLSASGKGEGSPVAGNDSATSRQQNRRVEVIIENPSTAR